MTPDRAARGLLCIWTDIDPAHEADFNRWYDREHMQERVAIPGFQSARRFAAVGPCPRPYLALYFTDSLDVFTSGPYTRAFANQTPWSLENFKRMRGTQRRVGALTLEAGEGEGGSLAAFVLPAAVVADAQALAGVEAGLRQAVSQDAIVRSALLRTDPELSKPLTADAVPPPADALVMLEGSRPQACLDLATALAAEHGVAAGEVYLFQSLWRLGA
ncbi:DUF4286 family protein [Ramlibacter rhizophilus]|uniref:Sugar ABC transporter n=1 Tax=Ramlibacter rhizophilus TaxID=1781167 RepID=A0A4Z0BSZ4_9BURK|nr:DUF4286 family protein [Ramlibacter rhizophilus]TFZ01155.1 hypothetical protein EZ242_07125 [Ramlibacter rhizophilus]